MTVYVILYALGWPEDGDAVAGVYSTKALADAAAEKNSTALICEINMDADPDYSLQRD